MHLVGRGPHLALPDLQLNLLTLCPTWQVSPTGKHGAAERRHNRKRALKLPEEKVIVGGGCSLVRPKGRKSRTDEPDLRMRSHFTHNSFLSFACQPLHWFFHVNHHRNANLCLLSCSRTLPTLSLLFQLFYVSSRKPQNKFSDDKGSISTQSQKAPPVLKQSFSKSVK